MGTDRSLWRESRGEKEAPILPELVKLLTVQTCLRVDGVNLRLLQEMLAGARAGRKCVWERLARPKLVRAGI